MKVVMKTALDTIRTMILKGLNRLTKTRTPMEQPLLIPELEKAKRMVKNIFLKWFLRSQLNSQILRIGELAMVQRLLKAML